VVVGASTGGVTALGEVLGALPADAPGMVVVQHMPPGFTAALARRLDERCHVRVAEARDGDHVRDGWVLVAPGDRHVRLRRDGDHYAVEVLSGPRVNGHCPSVDVLFHSAAGCAGPNALGVVLTGMGVDGSAGLLALRRAGAATVVQDEATSVVFGMPAEAIRVGAAGQVVPLGQVAGVVARFGAARAT
jgi:two-component system chemotaxis response regulator CheB